MKKLATLLALPLIALALLAGCGKTERTAEETLQLMNSAVQSYNYKINDTTEGNWLFARGDDGKQSKKMFVTYTNAKKEESDTGLNSLIVNSSNLLGERYALLKQYYQVELDLIFTYYDYYEETFFKHIADKDYDKDHLIKLYDKMVDYKNQLAKFVEARENLERNVALFGYDSEILTAKIDRFYYDYNQLINKSLSFVKYFKDLHKRYFYSELSVIDEDYAIRLYYEGLLTLADYIYTDIFRSLEKNSTVQLSYSYGASKDLYNTNAFNNTYFKRLLTSYALKAIDADLLSALRATDKTTPTYKKAEDTVKQLEINLENFKEYFDLYKICIGKIDFENYNVYRFNMKSLETSQDSYKNLISNKGEGEVYNVRVIQDIEQNKANSFLKVLYTFINY